MIGTFNIIELGLRVKRILVYGNMQKNLQTETDIFIQLFRFTVQPAHIFYITRVNKLSEKRQSNVSKFY